MLQPSIAIVNQCIAREFNRPGIAGQPDGFIRMLLWIGTRVSMVREPERSSGNHWRELCGD